MLSDAEQRCSELGITTLKLEVAENNKNALRLYSAFQFKMYDKIENYYPDNITAIRMKKQLLIDTNNIS